MMHVLSVQQFKDKALLDKLFKRAAELQAMSPDLYPKILQHKTIATIFYEPSTRTRLSFEAAIQNLGASLISTENAGQFSSAAKGETIEDSTRTINAYADGIVMRHPEVGSVARAAEVSDVPVINAGDGAGEHPTQALLDMYSIRQGKGGFDGLTIAMVGDLMNGRTIHSLLPLLSLYKVNLALISPESLALQQNYLTDLDKAGINYRVINDWSDALAVVDVLYMTRVQKERFVNEADYNKVKNDFILTMEQVKQMKKDAIILHPLPRVNEIDTAVDADSRAYYFKQVKNGLFMRMALLDYVYSEK
jgi:aspartate carbamoyltransferase catalytic subunit